MSIVTFSVVQKISTVKIHFYYKGNYLFCTKIYIEMYTFVDFIYKKYNQKLYKMIKHISFYIYFKCKINNSLLIWMPDVEFVIKNLKNV